MLPILNLVRCRYNKKIMKLVCYSHYCVTHSEVNLNILVFVGKRLILEEILRNEKHNENSLTKLKNVVNNSIVHI